MSPLFCGGFFSQKNLVKMWIHLCAPGFSYSLAFSCQISDFTQSRTLFCDNNYDNDHDDKSSIQTHPSITNFHRQQSTQQQQHQGYTVLHESYSSCMIFSTTESSDRVFWSLVSFHLSNTDWIFCHLLWKEFTHTMPQTNKLV